MGILHRATLLHAFASKVSAREIDNNAFDLISMMAGNR